MLFIVMCLSVSLFSCVFSDKDGDNNGGVGNGDEGNGDNGGENDGGNENENNGGNSDENDGTSGGGDENKNDGSAPSDEDEKLEFTVTVLDSDGNAKSSVKVILYDKSGNRVKTVATNKQGTAILKKIDSGSYTFALESMSGEEELIYSEELCALSASQKTVTVTVYSRLTEKNYSISGDGLNENEKAYSIAEESAYLKLPKGKIVYVVFTPERNGVHSFSVTGVDDALVANFGIADYVIQKDVSEFSEGKCSVEVAPLADANSVYTPTCFAIYSKSGGDALITVSRTSDLPNRPEYVKWTEIAPKNTPEKQQLPASATFTSLDLSDADLKVVLGSDGYYHLGDENGDIIYITLTKDTQYIDAITTIRESAGINAYIYDASGNFVRKESYNAVIDAYAKICDDRLGICPLTEELANVIKAHGEHKRWWDLEAEGNVFVENNPSIISELAWLFACGTVN